MRCLKNPRWGTQKCHGLTLFAIAGEGAGEVEEADEGRLVGFEAAGLGEQAQHGVNVREMVSGNVAKEGAMDFVVAQAAMQPANEEGELHEDGCGYRKDGE